MTFYIKIDFFTINFDIPFKNFLLKLKFFRCKTAGTMFALARFIETAGYFARFSINAYLRNQKENFKLMSDLADYDFFATQFASSLVQEATTGNGNWFGRLVKFNQKDEFQLINFFGTNFTESEFREALANDTIIITVFDVSNINYSPNLTDPLFATVTADVYIEASINSTDHTGDFTITHNIRNTWQSYETTLTETI